MERRVPPELIDSVLFAVRALHFRAPPLSESADYAAYITLDRAGVGLLVGQRERILVELAGGLLIAQLSEGARAKLTAAVDKLRKPAGNGLVWVVELSAAGRRPHIAAYAVADGALRIDECFDGWRPPVERPLVGVKATRDVGMLDALPGPRALQRYTLLALRNRAATLAHVTSPADYDERRDR
jgi:hypothetical protein